MTAAEFGRRIEAFVQPAVLVEAAAVLACLLAAWLLVRLWRGRAPRPGSIWFGDRVIDGVLFPVLALVLVLLVQVVLQNRVAPALLRLVVPVLISLVAIRLTVRVLHSAFPQSSFVRVVERSVSWLAWLAVAAWITGLLPLVLAELETVRWTFGTTQVSLRGALEGLLTAVVVLVVVLWVSAALEARLLAGSVVNLSVRKMAANALRVLLLFVGLMFALSAAGIDLTALGVLGGAVGVGIGFGLQKLASNYISGFVILAERSIRIGDVVKVDNFEGRVTDITTRYTTIRAASGREALVPNEMMITQRVENATVVDPKALQSTTLRVAFGCDAETLLPQLAAAAAAVPRVLDQPPPAVQLSAFADNGLELTVAFWIADPATAGAVRSEVHLALLRALAAAGAELALPPRIARNA